jgi:hypothetical protein
MKGLKNFVKGQRDGMTDIQTHIRRRKGISDKRKGIIPMP